MVTVVDQVAVVPVTVVQVAQVLVVRETVEALDLTMDTAVAAVELETRVADLVVVLGLPLV
jgi:hypothetical protein